MHQRQPHEYLENYNEFSKIATQMTKRFQEYSQEVLNDLITANSKQLELWTKAKTPEEIFELQNRLFNEARENLADASKKTVNLALENFADFNHLLESYVNMLNPVKQQQAPARPTIVTAAGGKK